MRRYWETEEAYVRRLKDDLWSARNAILKLLPNELSTLCETYYRCKTRTDTYKWERAVLDHVISLAKVLPKDEGSYWQDRAYCPLCGDGSAGPYDRGFAVPNGLDVHLQGSGNARHCSVMKQILELAREHWATTVAVAEEQERHEEERRKQQRKKTETVYLIDPQENPVLIDELSFGDEHRDQEGLSWAENRLIALGFQIGIAGREKRYTLTRSDYVVFADPRMKKKISFRLFKSALPRGRRRERHCAPTLDLQDRWRNDLQEKFDHWLNAAIQQIAS